MTGARPIYSVLLVSAAKKINTALMPFFPPERFEPVTVADSAARARRILADRDYDLVIINAPLPDEFGRKLAVDVCIDSERVALLLVRSDMYDEIRSVMSAHGSMCSVRERLRGMRKKTMTLEEKMEEIRLVNRAKWALIESRSMSEEEAHRYIQKLSMDMCLSKKETAENILRGRL